MVSCVTWASEIAFPRRFEVGSERRSASYARQPSRAIFGRSVRYAMISGRSRCPEVPSVSVVYSAFGAAGFRRMSSSRSSRSSIRRCSSRRSSAASAKRAFTSARRSANRAFMSARRSAIRAFVEHAPAVMARMIPTPMLSAVSRSAFSVGASYSSGPRGASRLLLACWQPVVAGT